MSKTKLSDNDVSKIIDLRNAGYGYERIGKMFHITRQRVRQICEDGGIEHKDYRYGENNVNWVGGTRKIDKNGYVNIYMPQDHPFYEDMKTRRGLVMEHRLVMAEHIGRPLYKYENVHHKNGIRDDNRIENLEIWVTKQPSGKRPEELVEYAKEILDLYGDMV